MGNSKQASEQYRNLFSSIQVGPITVKNRICETTNSINSSMAGGFLDDHFIEHHVAKARGGTAWIGSETWFLNSQLPPGFRDEYQEGAGTPSLALHQMPEFRDGVIKFCNEVHAVESVAIFQLTHLNFAWAASAVPVADLYDFIPHEMTTEAMDFVANTYVEAAQVAKECGGDGIEIHCAHESIPNTFLSPATNIRSDKYGGGPEQRVRYVIEILQKVRDCIGDSMALGIRLNGQESRQGGYDMLQMREMAYLIAESGLLDFINVDVGHCCGSSTYVPPSYHAPAAMREAGLALKTDVGDKVKILFSGRINEPIIAEELLTTGACDLVGMTRAGIADPDFPKKIREGRLSEMRRCIGCNRCIAERVHGLMPDVLATPVCSVNPTIGNELHWKENFKTTKNVKHVVVVGGGPAGLEAARVSSMRGHKVTLLEKGTAVGGQLRLAYKIPGRDSFEDFIYFQENEMTRLGVDLRLGTNATIESILSLNPDTVVIATGANPRDPHLVEGLDDPRIVQGWDVVGKRIKLGERVALISQEDYFETPNIAEYIATQGKQVDIFHKWAQVGKDIDRYSYGTVMKRLEENNIGIHTGLRLKAVTGDELVFISSYSGSEKTFAGYDSIVLVYGSVPNSNLYETLKNSGAVKQLFIAGSAWVPRRLAEATRHGANVALEI